MVIAKCGLRLMMYEKQLYDKMSCMNDSLPRSCISAQGISIIKGQLRIDKSNRIQAAWNFHPICDLLEMLYEELNCLNKEVLYRTKSSSTTFRKKIKDG